MSFWNEIKMQYRMGGVVEKLIYLNVALFAIPYILTGVLSLFSIRFGFIPWVSLSSDPSDLLWKPWSILTYAFFHSGIFHILFNLIIFYFISRLFLTFFTQKQLLNVYLVGALFAGVVYIFSYLVFPALISYKASLIGASGSVMAVMFATTTFAPQMQVRLLLIGNVKLWHIATFYLIVDLISLSSSNTGGHIAHLGGALFGYLFVKNLQRGNDITAWFGGFMDYITNGFKTTKKEKHFKKVYHNPSPKPNPKPTKDKTQQQIDEILDKISTSGYDSLTKEEKEFLFKAGKD
jgi:membrane associated rhomboid family serine protease